jgi:hypothetical protein
MRVTVVAGLVPGLLLSGLAAGVAVADEAPPTWHLFSGVDVTTGSTFAHQGFVWSPIGHLHEAGWRLRGLISSGALGYRTRGLNVAGRALAAEFASGRAWMWDNRGVQLYLGASIQDHATLPHDAEKSRQGSRFGGTALFEAWQRISEDLVLEASAAYATASRKYTARIAASVAVIEGLVLEPEIVALGEPGYEQLRVGLHAELYGTPRIRVLAGGGWLHDRDGGGVFAGLRVQSWR